MDNEQEVRDGRFADCKDGNHAECLFQWPNPKAPDTTLTCACKCHAGEAVEGAPASSERDVEVAREVTERLRLHLDSYFLLNRDWQEIVTFIVLSALHKRDEQERERAALIAELWGAGVSCTRHDDNPCCHVRTGREIAERIRNPGSM